MKNNKDFLRQFFKEQNIFQKNEDFSKTENIQNSDNYLKDLDTKQFTSNKNINLKALFQTIEEEKEKIKNIAINTKVLKKTKKEEEEKKEEELQNTEEKINTAKTQKPKLISFCTQLATKKNNNRNKNKKSKQEIKNPKTIHTNFQKFTVKKEYTKITVQKTEQKITANTKIEDLASFDQIIATSHKKIELKHILESQNRGNGKNRLSRVDSKNRKQKEYLLDLWEKQPERYSKHDQEIEKEQKTHAKRIKILEQNKKKQELKQKVIKEFNSYSTKISDSAIKTRDFFSNYIKNSKNIITEKYLNYKKSKKINTLLEKNLEIKRKIRKKRVQEIEKEQKTHAKRIKILEQNKKKQELKQKVIKEFNSYSTKISDSAIKTRDFFSNYIKNSKNIITEKYLNYKKSKKINTLLEKNLEIKQPKENLFITIAKEWIKISALVATIFIIGTFTLRAPGYIAQYDNILNPRAFSEQQNSLSNLLEKNKNPFQNVESLPVAGIKNNSEKTNSNEYLIITPPDRRIIIPKIAKNIPILEVDPINLENGKFSEFEADVQKMLKDGVVHYPGTANPGQNGNVFITGHSSYYPWDNGKYKDVFAALHNLEEGDEYYIFDKGKKYKYIITTRKVVEPHDVSVLDQDYNKKISTLMTCTPVGTAKNRLILQAEMVESGY